MKLRGKRIAVLVDNAYQEMEVWYPYFRFKEAGAECVLVGAEAGKTYLSKPGYPAKAEKSYDHISAAEFDTYAKQAEASCPISNALRSVPISVTSTLTSG